MKLFFLLVAFFLLTITANNSLGGELESIHYPQEPLNNLLPLYEQLKYFKDGLPPSDFEKTLLSYLKIEECKLAIQQKEIQSNPINQYFFDLLIGLQTGTSFKQKISSLIVNKSNKRDIKNLNSFINALKALFSIYHYSSNFNEEYRKIFLFKSNTDVFHSLPSRKYLPGWTEENYYKFYSFLLGRKVRISEVLVTENDNGGIFKIPSFSKANGSIKGYRYWEGIVERVEYRDHRFDIYFKSSSSSEVNKISFQVGYGNKFHYYEIIDSNINDLDTDSSIIHNVDLRVLSQVLFDDPYSSSGVSPARTFSDLAKAGDIEMFYKKEGALKRIYFDDRRHVFYEATSNNLKYSITNFYDFYDNSLFNKYISIRLSKKVKQKIKAYPVMKKILTLEGLTAFVSNQPYEITLAHPIESQKNYSLPIPLGIFYNPLLDGDKDIAKLKSLLPHDYSDLIPNQAHMLIKITHNKNVMKLAYLKSVKIELNEQRGDKLNETYEMIIAKDLNNDQVYSLVLCTLPDFELIRNLPGTAFKIPLVQLISSTEFDSLDLSTEDVRIVFPINFYADTKFTNMKQEDFLESYLKVFDSIDLYGLIDNPVAYDRLKKMKELSELRKKADFDFNSWVRKIFNKK